eukprot:jgi/Botrbrau1/6708/Bobra.0202s0043.1
MGSPKPSGPWLSQDRGETPTERLSNFFSFFTWRVKHGDPVPNPPPEIVDWAQNTVLGAFAGLIYCGYREWNSLRILGRYQPPISGLTQGQVARLLAEDQSRRLARIGTEALRGAFRFGSLTSVFFAIQHTCAIARQQIDVVNTTVAAGTTGSLFGFFAAPLRGRGRSALLGGLLGVGVGLPTGWLQLQLLRQLPEDQLRRRGLFPVVDKDNDTVPKSSPHRDATGSVINYLERSLGGPGKETPR